MFLRKIECKNTSNLRLKIYLHFNFYFFLNFLNWLKERFWPIIKIVIFNFEITFWG